MSWICLLSVAIALTATEIADKSEAVYARGQTFSAKFQQKLSTGDFFHDEKTEGTMVVSYPDKFRIETPEQTLVSNGDSLWSYSVENRQVTIEAMKDLPEVVTPADYLFRLKEHFSLTLDSAQVIDKRLHHRLRLKALSEEDFVRDLQLYIDQETHFVRRVVYRDLNDNLITLDFSDWKLGIESKPELFRFKTPKGVEEVRVP